MFGLKLAQWSSIGQIASAVTAIVFVVFGFYQLIKLRKQVILSSDAVDAAKDAADAARETTRETARVRIDEQAPRVLVVMESPQWPPRVSRNMSHMPYANEPRMFDSQTLHGAANAGPDDYIFPEQEQWFMWFITRGVLINEGRSTARVRLDGEARFIDGESALIPDEKILCPPSVGTFHGASYISREHLLRPGEKALFEWAYGNQLKEWAEKHDQGTPPECSFMVMAFDSTEHGVIDQINVALGARPLEPVPSRQGHWRLVSDPNTGVTVYPTQRKYRGVESSA